MAKRKKNRKTEMEAEVPVYNPFGDSFYAEYLDLAEDMQYIWDFDRFENTLDGYVEAGDLPYFINRLRKEDIEYESWIYAMKQVLENEDEAMEIILKKLLTNRQEIFISASALFLMLCEKNPCEWIMANYAEMAGENAKAYMCLVLGVRGEGKYRDFLMEEADRLLLSYPDEDYHVAPMLAVLGSEGWR